MGIDEKKCRFCRGFRISADCEVYDRLEEKIGRLATIYVEEDRQKAIRCFYLMAANLLLRYPKCSWCDGRGCWQKIAAI